MTAEVRDRALRLLGIVGETRASDHWRRQKRDEGGENGGQWVEGVADTSAVEKLPLPAGITKTSTGWSFFDPTIFAEPIEFSGVEPMGAFGGSIGRRDILDWSWREMGLPPTETQPQDAPKKTVKPRATRPKKLPPSGRPNVDFSAYERVGPPQGGNPGGVFRAPDGTRWYIKAQQSELHARNEALAAALYAESGLEAPLVIEGSGAPDLGPHQTATRIIDGIHADLRSRPPDAVWQQIHDGFAVDAWLANWDVVGENPDAGFDNIVTTTPYHDPTGTAIRIDAGGALLYRGLGTAKGKAFGPVVTEWDRFRDEKGRTNASTIFSRTPIASLRSSAARVEAISPNRIRELVAEYGLPASLAETLTARRADVISRAANLENPAFTDGALEGPDSAGTAVPSRSSELVSPEAVEAVRAWKRDDVFIGLQRRLIKGTVGATGRSVAARTVRGIDAAMIPTKADIIVWRGERNPSRSFARGQWSPVGGMDGAEWNFGGYMATTADESIATGFATDFDLVGDSQGRGAQPTVMRIRVPAGTPAMAIDHSDDRDAGGSGWYSDEHEVLVERGRKYRIAKDYGVVGGVRRLDVEVVA